MAHDHDGWLPGIDRVPRPHRKMLTTYHKGSVKAGAVTMVISGDR